MAQIRADLQLNCDRFLSSIRSVNEAIEEVQHHVLAFSAGFEGLRLAGEQIAEQFEHVREALELGAQMENLHNATGQSVSDLVLLRQVFTGAGLSIDDLQPALKGLSKALTGVNEDGEPTAAVFKRLGVSMHALRAMTTVQQFTALQEAFAEIQNPADRARDATDLLGKSGARLLAVFGNEDAFAKARTQLGELPDNLEANAAAMKEVSEALESLKTKFLQLYAGIAGGAAGEAKETLDSFEKLDFSELGTSIGMLTGKFLHLLNAVSKVKETLLAIAGPASQALQLIQLAGYLVPSVKPQDVAQAEASTHASTDAKKIENVSSEEERVELAKQLQEEWQKVGEKMDGAAAHVQPDDLGPTIVAYQTWMDRIQADKETLAQIPPEILKAREAESHRAEATAESARKVEDLEKAYQKLREETAKAALEALPPEQHEKILLGDAGQSSVAALDATIEQFQQNMAGRSWLDPDGKNAAVLDAQQAKLQKLIDIRTQLIPVERQITEERKKQADQAEKDLEKAAQDETKRAGFEEKAVLEIRKLVAEGRGDQKEVDRLDREQRYNQEYESAIAAGEDPKMAEYLATKKVQAQDKDKAEKDGERDDKDDKVSVVADENRRVGLGGSAVAHHTDPLIKAHQDSARAMGTLTTAVDKLRGQLGKAPDHSHPAHPITVFG